MGQIELYAHAKITLSLDILRRLDDGYHELKSVMTQINLSDQIRIYEKKDNEIQITSDTSDMPLDHNNLVWKAIDLLRSQYHIKQGVDVHIKKVIPIEGGLAGGSADAASALVGLNDFWKLGLTKEELIYIGSKIGYDVCYCVIGGTALVKGKGEIVKPITTNLRFPLVLANPGFGISTKLAYQALDLKKIGLKIASDRMARAVESMDLKNVVENLNNDFETVILGNYPKIFDLKNRIQSEGALGVLLSGSGSSVYGIMSSIKNAKKVGKLLSNEGIYSWSGWSCAE